jgi:HNH endonuclease
MQVRAEVTPRLRLAIIKRDRGMCRYCTIRPKWQNIEIDHVRPVISGGKSTMENCVTACRTCNQKKGWSPRWVPLPLDEMPKQARLNNNGSVSGQTRITEPKGRMTVAARSRMALGQPPKQRR